jgi:hypothetical protein
MAMSPAPVRSVRHSPWWARLHFLVHFLGLTGLLAVSSGLVLAHAFGLLPAQSLQDAVTALVQGQWREVSTQLSNLSGSVQQALQGSEGDRIIALMVLIGAAAILLYLLIEAIIVAALVAGRRSALGFNATFQIVLVLVLFVCVNVWSFWHPVRYDWTRERQFTLPADVVRGLQRLDPQEEGADEKSTDRRTTVIVYLRHRTFGTLSDSLDQYDNAAQLKVVEKVKDLAEQLRRLGKQLRVEVLDVKAEDYNDRLAALTRDAEPLRQAIESAPENSLFFFARGGKNKMYVQRLSFNDFYLLDKKASQEANGGKGNLVLLSQGMEPFARRILHIDERRPRVGIAVIHDILSSKGREDMGLTGLRRALETHGFEVQDIVLKKWGEMGPPQPAASTREESQLARLDATQSLREQNIRTLEKLLPSADKRVEVWNKALTDSKARAELARRLADELGGQELTEGLVKDQLEAALIDRAQLQEALDELRKRLENTLEQKKGLNEPQLREQQRLTDVGAKMARLLADCDVLIVPRMTLRNAASAFDNIPGSVYRLDDTQTEAIRDFLKQGKPLLACFGPANEPQDRPSPPGEEGPDPLEKLLGQLGIRFGKQTILFFDEEEGFGERRAGLEVAGTTVVIPPVRFTWQRGEGRPEGSLPPSDRVNPLRRALELASASLGTGQELDIRIRHPRPVYFVRDKKARIDFDPDFLMTSARSWNEDKPFPTADYVPQFHRPEDRTGKPQDSKKEDPLETRRRGPFPIGVAVQTQLPSIWYDSLAAPRATVRVAALGQGGFFAGKDLSPAQEKLMVNTLDWLLGREDYLPHEGQRWSYPRVNLPDDEPAGRLWRWGVFGLPVLALYVGGLVWLLRRIH